MAGNGGNDFFLDDDFSDIPDDELQRLEQDAITFTQQEQVPSRPLNSRLLPQGFAPHSAQKSNPPPPNKQLVTNLNAERAQQEYFEEGFFGEDATPNVVEDLPQIITQRRLDETAQREQWRINRFAQPQVQVAVRLPSLAQPTKPKLQPSTHHSAHDSRSNVQQPVQLQHSAAQSIEYRNAEENALRAKISELMKEKNELATNLQKAKEEIYTRKGEVQNIRAKQDDQKKTYERQLATMQKLRQDDEDKHVTAIQAVTAENAKIVSEIQFVRQELKEESRKAQTYQRQLRERPKVDKHNNAETTPKRNRTLRDGFDDDEIVMISPVKSGKRSKPGTPTANRKRKQPTSTELNIKPLALRLSGTDAPSIEAHEEVPHANSNEIVPIIQRDRAAERSLRLIQSTLNMRSGGGREVFLEQLFKLSFPSDPKTTLGSIVVSAVAKLEGHRLAGDLTQIFLDVWSKALEEKHHICIPLLIEAVSYIFDQNPFVIDKPMLTALVTILTATIEINGAARFHLMKNDPLVNLTKSKPMIDPVLDNTACLELLYTTTCLISDDGELITQFWGTVHTDFVLMMLNACQTIPDLTLMLRILATSILPDTFSNICDSEEQSKMEGYTCDRVCFLLWEIPKSDPDKAPYSLRDICHLRQEALNLLTQLTLGSAPNPSNPATANNHGTKFLANHPVAISRLVRLAYNELARAYLMAPTQPLHTRLVNMSIRILHFVMFSPAGRHVDLQSVISGINSGAHKFRVVMARLACVEQSKVGIDAGISEDTVRMATEMLEERITPDEVDDLERVFEGMGTGTSKRASLLALPNDSITFN